jgi:4-hydroxy-3-polyprenylbenzoate decarboxylase
MKHLRSFREFIAALHEIGEVQNIHEEVDLDLEIGAICRRVYETGAAAPLFEKIKGVASGYRILGCPGGVSHKHGYELARIAIALGLPPTAHGRQIVEILADTRIAPRIPPKIVATGECQENIFLGDDIDLYRLPCPLLHDGDGGRFLNTYGVTCVRTPDHRWTNWSIARAMVADKRSLAGLIVPLQHIGMIHAEWKRVDKPTPFAIAFGVAPAIPYIAGMPLPAEVNESDVIGGLTGTGVEVVRCKTVPLEVPANAEIVLEGHISHTETAIEGPMGEYAGYLWNGPGSQKPVYKITAITHRNQPILPVSVAGTPVEENHTGWGIPTAGEVLADLRASGIPVTTAWMPFDAANHWLAVCMPRDWKRMTGINTKSLIEKIAEVLFHSKAGVSVPKIILMNDDIDPTNLRELTWALATRCHPVDGEVRFLKESINPLVAYLQTSEKQSMVGAKVVYNCLPPDEWGDRLPTRSSFARAYPEAIKEKVIQKWHKYGYR